MGGRRREHARGRGRRGPRVRALGQPPVQTAQGLCMRISRGTVGGKARDPRARLGGGGGVGGEGKSDSGV